MKNIYLMLFLLVLLTLGTFTQISIDAQRTKEGLSSRYLFQPAEAVNNMIAGGFQGLAVDLLWVRIDEYSHHGQWYKLLPIFKTVTFLQPKFILGWSVGAWHMSFNLYFHSKALEEKQKWLNTGLQFLKEGIQHNPDRYELYFEAGWTYFFKAEDYPNAIRYLKRAIRFKHPQFVEHTLAHAYERNGDLVDALQIWKYLQNKEDHEKSMETVVNRQVKKIEELLEPTS